MDIDVLLQITKLINLIESPIFVCILTIMNINLHNFIYHFYLNRLKTLIIGE
jgi:hypothetical protein